MQGLIRILWGIYIVGATTLPISSGFAQEDSEWETCTQNTDPDKKITACTNVLAQAGKMSPMKRALAYGMRGFGYTKRDFNLAVDNYTESLRILSTIRPPPTKAMTMAHIFRGDAFLGNRQFEQAAKDYDKAALLSPMEARVYRGRGRIYYEKADYDHAIAEFDQALRRNPSVETVHYYRGMAYSGKGDLDKALTDYDEALRLSPQDALALVSRGDIWLKKEDFDRAITDFDAALQVSGQTSSSIVLTRRAIALLGKRDYEGSLANLDQSLKHDPKYARSLHIRALVFFSRGLEGDLDQAKADVEAALGIDPNNPEMEKLRGSIEHGIADQKAGIKPAGKRVALVIGNGAYMNAPHLKNPPNDAKSIAEVFRNLGFEEVTEHYDLGIREIAEDLKAFGDKSASADWAVVYFAGHGIQVDGETYLIPTDAKLARAAHVTDEAVPLTRVLGKVSDARLMRLVIVDACRNNPFVARMKKEGGARSLGRGLAPIENTGGVLVAYATRDGQVAEDGNGEHSPFTQALLEHLQQPSLEIGLLFRNVRDSVFMRTGGIQEPYTYGSLPSHEFYFKQARR